MKELMCLSAVAVAALAVAEQRITVYAPTANLEEFRTVAVTNLADGRQIGKCGEK